MALKAVAIVITDSDLAVAGLNFSYLDNFIVNPNLYFRFGFNSSFDFDFNLSFGFSFITCPYEYQKLVESINLDFVQCI